MKILILTFLNIFNVHANYDNGLVEKSVNMTLFKCQDTDFDIENTLTVPQQFMDIKKPYTFRLESSINEIDCPSDERFNYTVVLKDNEEGLPLFTTHGILMVNTESHRVYRKSKDFCVQSMDENSTLTLSVCKATCDNYGSNKLCIKKCCGIHKLLGYDSNEPESVSCQLPNQGHSNLQWKPVIYHDVRTKLTEDEHLAIQPNFFNSFGFYNCLSTAVLIQPHPEFSGEYNNNTNIGRFRFLTNGDLAVCSGNGKWVTFKDSTYCIDSMQNFGQDSNSPSGDLTTQVVIRCLDDFSDSKTDESTVYASQLKTILYKMMIPFSSIFLFMIIIVYSLILDKQNVYGYTVYSYTWSLFLLYVTLSVQSFLNIGTQECKFVGGALHFFFISTFSFLTALNFDIFYNFRVLQVCTYSKNVRRFILYVLFSILVPTIIISIGLLLELNTKPKIVSCEAEENETVYITPRYGQKVCGVIEEAQGWYMYLPVALLLGCNLIFFGMTLYNLRQTTQSINADLKGNSTKEDQPLIRIGRLFIVMGVSWSLEFVGWALKQTQSVYSSTLGFLFIFDTINVLQAIAIFYLFVCKNHVFKLLWQKHLWLRPLLSLSCIKNGCCGPRKRRTSSSSSATSWSSRKTSLVSIFSRISGTKETTTQV